MFGNLDIKKKKKWLIWQRKLNSVPNFKFLQEHQLTFHHIPMPHKEMFHWRRFTRRVLRKKFLLLSRFFKIPHPVRDWNTDIVTNEKLPSSPQSLPASESFPMSQHFAWGGQSTGVSASASFLPKESQGWSPSEWTGWISLHTQIKNSNYIDA